MQALSKSTTLFHLIDRGEVSNGFGGSSTSRIGWQAQFFPKKSCQCIPTLLPLCVDRCQCIPTLLPLCVDHSRIKKSVLWYTFKHPHLFFGIPSSIRIDQLNSEINSDRPAFKVDPCLRSRSSQSEFIWIWNPPARMLRLRKARLTQYWKIWILVNSLSMCSLMIELLMLLWASLSYIYIASRFQAPGKLAIQRSEVAYSFPED